VNIHNDSNSSVFLDGRSVYLRAPDLENDVQNGQWHNWFNHYGNTRFLSHGVFPVSKEEQLAFVKAALADRGTLLLSIVNKTTHAHEGVISLKHIDFMNRVAEIGIVTAPKNRLGGTGAFEAMALLIKHAFSRLNLDLLYAGQHEGLWKWVNSLFMLGFRIEGVRNHAGVRNRDRYGIFQTSVSAKDFFELEAARGGDVLNPSPLEVLKGRPVTNPMDIFQEGLAQLNAQWSQKKGGS